MSALKRFLLVFLLGTFLLSLGWAGWRVVVPAYYWRAAATPLFENCSKPSSAWSQDQGKRFWESLIFLNTWFPGVIQRKVEEEFQFSSKAEREQLLHLTIVLTNLDKSRLDWPVIIDHRIPRYEGVRRQVRYLESPGRYESFVTTQAAPLLFESEDEDIRSELVFMCSLEGTHQGGHNLVCAYGLRDPSQRIRVHTILKIAQAPEAGQHVECLRKLMDREAPFMQTVVWGALALILKDPPSRREFVRRFGEEGAGANEPALLWMREVNLKASVVKGLGKPGDPDILRDWATSPYHSGPDRDLWLKVWRDWTTTGELDLEGVDNSK